MGNLDPSSHPGQELLYCSSFESIAQLPIATRRYSEAAGNIHGKHSFGWVDPVRQRNSESHLRTMKKFH